MGALSPIHLLILLLVFGTPIVAWRIARGSGPRYGSATDFIAFPHPWTRYFARTLDIVLFLGPLLFIIARIAPSAVSGRGVEYLIRSGLLFAWVFVEALLLSSVGMTPGKWFLGVRIQQRSGERLSFSQALRRGLKVWWRGLAAGFPLATLTTLAVAHAKLTRNGSTSWDREGGFVVVDEPLSTRRMAIIIVIIVLGALAVRNFVSAE